MKVINDHSTIYRYLVQNPFSVFHSWFFVTLAADKNKTTNTVVIEY